MKLPLSGGEDIFRIKPWGTDGMFVDNCYAYAMGDHRKFRQHKSVPGMKSGTYNPLANYRSCGNIAKQVAADNPNRIKIVKPTTKCAKDTFKVMVFVSPTNSVGDTSGDFHFYKQHGIVEYKVKKDDTVESVAKFFHKRKTTIIKANKNRQKLIPGTKLTLKINLFSHKRGWGGVPLLKDSNGKMITNPIKAGKKYTHNYSKYCSSFCVKNKGTKVNRPDNLKIRQNPFKSLGIF
tara:strand:- start:10271 stop:10975 length:705 start_codon:yes stop_codon:yes gene_type:complete